MAETDYLARNRAFWDSRAHAYLEAGERNWSQEPSWGIWSVPEAKLGLLPIDMSGLDAIELGCGTAYVSAWLARRGARPVGIDISPEQLAAARRLQAAHGLAFPLHLGNADYVIGSKTSRKLLPLFGQVADARCV